MFFNYSKFFIFGLSILPASRNSVSAREHYLPQNLNSNLISVQKTSKNVLASSLFKTKNSPKWNRNFNPLARLLTKHTAKVSDHVVKVLDEEINIPIHQIPFKPYVWDKAIFNIRKNEKVARYFFWGTIGLTTAFIVLAGHTIRLSQQLDKKTTF